MKKLLVIVTTLCLLIVLASCGSESSNSSASKIDTSIAGEYIPQYAYCVDDSGRTLQCDGYEETSQSSGITKIVLNADGTGCAVSSDGQTGNITWKDGTLTIPGAGEMLYTLKGNELTLKPVEYKSMPRYMEMVLVKQ